MKIQVTDAAVRSILNKHIDGAKVLRVFVEGTPFQVGGIDAFRGEGIVLLGKADRTGKFYKLNRVGLDNSIKA